MIENCCIAARVRDRRNFDKPHHVHKQITFWWTGINTIYEVPPGGWRTTAEYKSKALNCKTKLSYQGSLTPGSTLLRFRNGRGMDQILSELQLSSKTKRRNRLEYKAKHSLYGSYNKKHLYKVQTEETNYI